jgi:hypothetical protein
MRGLVKACLGAGKRGVSKVNLLLLHGGWFRAAGSICGMLRLLS